MSAYWLVTRKHPPSVGGMQQLSWHIVDQVSRSLPVSEVERLVAEHTTAPQFGLLGAPRVNVLELNLALDGARKAE